MEKQERTEFVSFARRIYDVQCKTAINPRCVPIEDSHRPSTGEWNLSKIQVLSAYDLAQLNPPLDAFQELLTLRLPSEALR